MRYAIRTVQVIALVALISTIQVPGQTADQPGTESRSMGLADFEEVGAGPTPEWVLDAPALPEGTASAPMVIRLLDTQLRIDTEHVEFHHIAIQVNDPAMLQFVGQQTIDFVPDYQTVRLHTLRLLRGDDAIDKRKTASIRVLQRETGLERGVYNGAVTAAIVIEDVRVGDTLELAFSIAGRNPVFLGRFFEMTRWEGSGIAPLEYRRIVLNRPAERHVWHRVVGPDPSSVPQPTEIDLGDRVAVVFEAESIPPRQIDAVVPKGYLPLNHIQFSEFESWKAVAGWASGLFELHAEVDALPWERIDSIRELPSDERRVAAALKYVQDEIRYLAESFGESTHRPTPPAEVTRRRYGDCKDKTLLLVAILRELGIASDPVLVTPSKTGDIAKWLPAPGVFDHAIVRAFVEDRWYYLDPTRLGQVGNLERLGQAFDGSEVLVVKADIDRLIRVPDGDPGAIVRSEIVERVTISDFDAPPTLEVRSTFHGLPAESIRLQTRHAPPEEIERSLLAQIAERFPTASVAEPPTIEDDSTLNTLTFVESYVVPDLADDYDDHWRIDYTPTGLQFGILTAPSPDRSSPIGLLFPIEQTYVFEVTLPREFSTVSDPTTDVIANEFFEFTISRRFRGNVARHEYTLRTLAREVPVTALQSYGREVRELGEKNIPDIRVPKQASSDPDATWLSPEERVYRMFRADAESDRARCTRIIQFGRVTGTELASVLRRRGQSYLILGKHRKALRDAQKAIRLDGSDPDHYFLRASILFRTGEYERSIADYTKALSLGGDPAIVLYRRGQAQFYGGRIEQALSDFSEAIAADHDPDSRAFRMLWYLWTARHLEEQIPEALKEEIAKEVSGDWPRPALGLFTGDRMPADIERLAASRNPEERVLMLCEAYFYIAQYHAVRGELTAAADYFEKSRATLAVGMTEFDAAQRELERLGRVQVN